MKYEAGGIWKSNEPLKGRCNMKIMVLGSGPERIGKTGELDRFAIQAFRYLKREGHEIVWVDNNPAILAVPHTETA